MIWLYVADYTCNAWYDVSISGHVVETKRKDTHTHCMLSIYEMYTHVLYCTFSWSIQPIPQKICPHALQPFPTLSCTRPRLRIDLCIPQLCKGNGWVSMRNRVWNGCFHQTWHIRLPHPARSCKLFLCLCLSSCSMFFKYCRASYTGDAIRVVLAVPVGGHWSCQKDTFYSMFLARTTRRSCFCIRGPNAAL